MKNFDVYLSESDSIELYNYIGDDKLMPSPDSHWYVPHNPDGTTEGEKVEHKQYTVGDLLKFLQYNYYFNVLHDPSLGESGKMIVHRRLVIKPVPTENTYNTSLVGEDAIIRSQYESNALNEDDEYEWRIMYDGEIFGSNRQLVIALRDACKKVYDKGLYKLDNPNYFPVRNFSLSDV